MVYSRVRLLRSKNCDAVALVTFNGSQDTVVLGKNVRLSVTFFGKDARSNPGANSSNIYKSNELETTQAQARERPPRRVGRRSERTRFEALKARKRDSIWRMWTKKERDKNHTKKKILSMGSGMEWLFNLGPFHLGALLIGVIGLLGDLILGVIMQ